MIDGESGETYELMSYNDEYMEWNAEAVTGKDKGKMRGGNDDDFIEAEAPTKTDEVVTLDDGLYDDGPVSPDYVPVSPDYVPESPTYVPESPTYGPVSPDQGPVSPDHGPVSPSNGPAPAETNTPVIKVDTGDMPEFDLGEPAIAEKTTVKILGNNVNEGLNVIGEVDENVVDDSSDNNSNDEKTKKVVTN
jgi:hypothetical protein